MVEKIMSPHPSPRPSGPSTTFVHTDVTTFKDIVQRLTGAHDETPSTTAPQTPSPNAPGIKRPTFKLQERRKGSRSKLTIVKPNPSLSQRGSVSPSSPRSYLFSPLISPSNDLLKLRLSDDDSSNSTSSSLEENAERKAIEERGVYLYSSPRGSRLRNVEPELLHLFPLSSSLKNVEH